MQWIKSGSPPCIQLPHEGLGALEQIRLFPLHPASPWGGSGGTGSNLALYLHPASHQEGLGALEQVWLSICIQLPYEGLGALDQIWLSPPASSFPMRRVWGHWSGSGSSPASSIT